MTRALLSAVLVAIGLATAAGAQAPSKIDLAGMLDAYASGRYDEAVGSAAAIADLGPFRLRYVQDAPLWVNQDPARLEARGAAAAGFLLEVAGARLETDWGRFSDLIEWTCVQLRKTGPPTEFERTWHAASHALAGRARTRVWLLGEAARLPHQKPVARPPTRKNELPPPMHLTHALERFPDDPAFQLSRIVAWTWGRDGEPVRNVRRREEDDLIARRRLTRAPQLEAVVALAPLTEIPAVAAEAWVRTGMVRFTAGDFAAALRAFETAQPIASEPAMKYLAHFEAGRTLEALSRPDDAIREYRRALEVVPLAESATIAMASLLFTRDEREPAIAQIDRVFNRRPGIGDPGRLIGYGSYLRWPELKAAMRKALR
jgi:tetratricopeptide (TPR) repeat protein